MGSWINQIYLINRVLAGNSDFKDLDWLSIDEKRGVADELLRNTTQAGVSIANITNCVAYLIPRLTEADRFPYVQKMIEALEQAGMLIGRAGYQVLDADLVRALPYNDRVSLAQTMVLHLQDADAFEREAAMWGMVRVAPQLRDIHQKEFAQGIFELNSDALLRPQALEALCAMIFQLGREQRSDMVYFFAEIFKRDETPVAKRFTVELLKRVTSCVLQKDRGQIADAVAPLLFHTDPELVLMAAEYFATVLGYLQPNERFHYADMVSSLSNDLALHDGIMTILAQMLPFMTSDPEKAALKRLMTSQSRGDDHNSGNFETAYATPLFVT